VLSVGISRSPAPSSRPGQKRVLIRCQPRYAPDPGRIPAGHLSGARVGLADHHPARRVDFINSDPSLIRFFLGFLDAAGVGLGRLRCRVQIHESADVGAATEFWLRVTGARPAQFHPTSLKRHNPRTVRKNVGDDYHGCLRIDVTESADLYRKIEGWARAAMRGLAPGAAPR
jgi:hypothetical protein